LQGLPLPSAAEIGRYLHQWDRFRRPIKSKPLTQRPEPPTYVHQRWQVDFKVQIALKDGTQVDLYTCRDPFAKVCIDAHLVPNGQVGTKGKRPSVESAQTFLRACFGRWHTLPDEIQTDGEPALSGRAGGTFFPTRFAVWLKGLGIDYRAIRPGRPTDNAEVERCHRTLFGLWPVDPGVQQLSLPGFRVTGYVSNERIGV
jgi:transposase InsO family protein